MTSAPWRPTSTGVEAADAAYVGWELCTLLANEFVVGYGLDYREKYRNLRDIGTLAPHVYS